MIWQEPIVHVTTKVEPVKISSLAPAPAVPVGPVATPAPIGQTNNINHPDTACTEVDPLGSYAPLVFEDIDRAVSYHAWCWQH